MKRRNADDDELPFGLRDITVRAFAAAALLYVACDPIKWAVARLGLGDGWAAAVLALAMFAGLWVAGLWFVRSVRRFLNREP